MNLKEAFRYQKYLEELLSGADACIVNPENAMRTVEHHYKSRAFANFEDEEITPEETDYIGNDRMLDFALFIVEERDKLSKAVSETKAGLDIDIDAAIETNKFRHRLASDLRYELNFKPSKRKSVSYGFYHNEVSGEQARYTYDVEIEKTEAFDRGKAINARKELMAAAEETSTKVDLALVASVVNYEPPFDVNGSFDEAVQEWVKTTEET